MIVPLYHLQCIYPQGNIELTPPPSERGLSRNAWYPQCGFKLQSTTTSFAMRFYRMWASCDRGILIMYASCVRLRNVALPCLKHYMTSTFLPLSPHRQWGKWDALKYWLLYGRLYAVVWIHPVNVFVKLTLKSSVYILHLFHTKKSKCMLNAQKGMN